MMKKITTILILTLLLFSCSDSSEKQIDNSLSIIGKWKLEKEIDNNIDITNDCYKKSTLTIDNNLSVNVINYDFNQNNECEISSQGTINTSKVNAMEYLYSNGSTLKLVSKNQLEIINDNGNSITTYNKI